MNPWTVPLRPVSWNLSKAINTWEHRIPLIMKKYDVELFEAYKLLDMYYEEMEECDKTWKDCFFISELEAYWPEH